MAKLTFRTDNCKGCGLCVDVCPKKVLQLAQDKINKRGHHPVEAARPDDCIGCGSCAIMCPDFIIKVER
ncbi:MAG: 4Fe-4S binding protein [Clostridia bacterium]|nr:4Fe-4S binding protein [Clostridia bacterium]